MTRHTSIVSALQSLQEQGAIQAFVRDAFENEPQRVRWHVWIDALEAKYFSTTEVEAFIAGARAFARNV